MLHLKIKKRRKEQGLSQEEMADLLGISPSAYGKLERGETRIDTDRLKQVANALEMDAADFFENETIIVTHHGDSSNSSDGVVMQPIYDTNNEILLKMVTHLEEEVMELRRDKEGLQKDKEVLLREKEQMMKHLEKATP